MRRAAGWIAGGALVLAVAAGCSKTDTTSTAPTSAPTTTASAGTSSSTAAPTSASAPTSAAPTSAAPGDGNVGADKASFLAAGNAICKQVNQTSEGYSKAYESGPKTPSAVQKLLDANGELIEGSVAQLKALPQPAGDEAQLASMYEGVLKLASFSHQMATATGQQDEAAVQRLQNEGKAQQTAVNKEFTAYGLTECGKGS